MTWQLGELMSEATAIAGSPPGLPTSRISQLANQAIRDVAVRLPHQEFEVLASASLTSGVDKLYLPDDAEAVISLSYNTDSGVANGGGWGIRQAAPWEIDHRSDGTWTGIPTMYVSYASWLEFYPSPNSGYSILLRYKKRVSDITSLTARASVDSRYDQAILYKTVEQLHLRKGEYDKVAAVRALYEQELKQIPNYFALKQRNRTGMGLRVQTEED